MPQIKVTDNHRLIKYGLMIMSTDRLAHLIIQRSCAPHMYNDYEIIRCQVTYDRENVALYFNSKFF